MNPATIDPDIDGFLDSHDINDLLDPDRGYLLVKGFLTMDQADGYRKECEHFLQTSKKIYKKINRYSKHDYIHSRSGEVIKGTSTYSMYQYFHNQHSRETEEIFRKVLFLRNQIEKNWLYNEAYRHVKENLYDYIQVTTYAEGRGISKHCDFKGTSPYPLLQCVVLLSQPQIDYLGGELVLYTKNDRPIKTPMEKGDALFFDKSLFHEVVPSQASQFSDIGRWSAIIGARYPNPPKPSERIKRVFREQVYRVKRLLSRCLVLLRSLALLHEDLSKQPVSSFDRGYATSR